jgi:hypothetical protein
MSLFYKGILILLTTAITKRLITSLVSDLQEFLLDVKMKNDNLKHEIMWWLSRLTIMMTSLFLSFTLASSAYAGVIHVE